MEEVQIEFEGSERFCNWFCGPSWCRFTFFWTAATFDVYCLKILKSCNETRNNDESMMNRLITKRQCRDLTYDSTWALKMKSCTLKRSSDVVYKEISAGSDQMFLEKKKNQELIGFAMHRPTVGPDSSSSLSKKSICLFLVIFSLHATRFTATVWLNSFRFVIWRISWVVATRWS